MTVITEEAVASASREAIIGEEGAVKVIRGEGPITDLMSQMTCVSAWVEEQSWIKITEVRVRCIVKENLVVGADMIVFSEGNRTLGWIQHCGVPESDDEVIYSQSISGEGQFIMSRSDYPELVNNFSGDFRVLIGYLNPQ